jgi:hypothetical protein
MFEFDGTCAGGTQFRDIPAGHLGELSFPSCRTQPAFCIALRGALLEVGGEAIGVLGQLLGDLRCVRSPLDVLRGRGRRHLLALDRDAVMLLGFELSNSGESIALVGDAVASVGDAITFVGVGVSFIGDAIPFAGDSVGWAGGDILGVFRRANPLLNRCLALCSRL